ncbi:WD40 repeat-like protein [Backusella circina FSU 941]|nr:WD40 repeat-like protein [Backusella circina FSU 941]
MQVLCTAPEVKRATIAELDGTLISAESGNDASLQDLRARNCYLYPSIEFQSITAAKPNFTNAVQREPYHFERLGADAVQFIQKKLNESLPLIQESAPYKKVEGLLKTAQETYSTMDDTIIDQDILKKDDQSFKCIAWHPHKRILAIGYKDSQIYVYEIEENQWKCRILRHEFMDNITCMEWKDKAAATLAVGCEKGVCVWRLEKDSTKSTAQFETYSNAVPASMLSSDASGTRPRFHPNASMSYFCYPDHHRISSLAWDPTPGSHLLAVACSLSNTLVIYDTLLNRVHPLKRYGKGSVLLRWSPNGKWLYDGGSRATTRIWNTATWSFKHFKNPPGLWVQAACWSPDSKSVFYSMVNKKYVHVLFLSADSIEKDVWEAQILDIPATTSTTNDGVTVPVGGPIKDITIEQKHGYRLAIAHENSDLLSLYKIKAVEPTNLRDKTLLVPIGYIRGAKTLYQPTGATDIIPIRDATPLYVQYGYTDKRHAVLAVAWNTGMVSFVTHEFAPDTQMQHFM